jgi:hypothetical protein
LIWDEVDKLAPFSSDESLIYTKTFISRILVNRCYDDDDKETLNMLKKYHPSKKEVDESGWGYIRPTENFHINVAFNIQ